MVHSSWRFRAEGAERGFQPFLRLGRWGGTAWGCQIWWKNKDFSLDNYRRRYPLLQPQKKTLVFGLGQLSFVNLEEKPWKAEDEIFVIKADKWKAYWALDLSKNRGWIIMRYYNSSTSGGCPQNSYERWVKNNRRWWGKITEEIVILKTDKWNAYEA